MRWKLQNAILIFAAIAAFALPMMAQQNTAEACTPAEIINDEGGAVVVSGEVAYTNPLFTAGVGEPLVILEDQAGFVDRDRSFLLPPESQVIGQITSDFFTSPFSYSISLPVEPQASLRDVDNDGEEDTGVMVYAIAYWTNVFGPPFLERRDLGGGGWSTAYASTRISTQSETAREIIGGKLLIYAQDDEQGFPSGFGEDGLLFTEDDPIACIPQGYSVVNLDEEPFTFDRSSEITVDLIEGEGSEVDDFSAMSYTQAFDAMIDKFRREYAFTEYKELDWDALSEEFRPLFEAAEENNDAEAYADALLAFARSIPDGHVSVPLTQAQYERFIAETEGGIGMAIRETDDGRTIANFILPDGPADEAGIELGAEIIEVNGTPVSEFVSQAQPWSAPFSSEHFRRLQELRYSTRFIPGTEVEITYRNPGEDEETATLTAIAERQSFAVSSFNVGRTGIELPIEFDVLPSGYGYVKIFSFFDNERLTVDLWERMIQQFKENGVPGIIIDMRQNGGGNGFLANQMAGYFFDEERAVGNTGFYAEDIDDFFFDPETERYMYPPEEELQYDGPVAVIVGPNCLSACEFFSYNMTLDDRAAIVGQYPTGGLGGSIEDFYMPGPTTVRITKGRGVDAEGNIHIEGVGVQPTVLVPVNEETLFSQGDPILEYAIDHLDSITGRSGGEEEPQYVNGGELSVGDEVTGEISDGIPVVYFLEIEDDGTIDFILGNESGEVDTYIRLYDRDGNLIGENDDAPGEDTLSSAIKFFDVTAGEAIIIEVGAFNDGEYTFTISESE